MSDIAKNTIGQRLVWTLDLPKTFKHKQDTTSGDGSEVELQRLYQLVLPYGAPFEEIHAVMEELLAEVKRLEEVSKEQAVKLAAENAAKEEQVAVDESATDESATN